MKGPALKGVVEVAEDFDGDTYRAAYIATLPSAVYVLHVFQKKSTHGIATPLRHLTVIRQRLRAARRLEEKR
jgi:phage-related protein